MNPAGLLSALLLLAMSLTTALAADIQSHDLQVRLNPALESMEARDNLILSGASGDIRLHLSPRITLISVSSPERRLPYSFSGGQLQISGIEPGPDGLAEIRIAYRGTFNDPVPQNPVSHLDPSYGVESVISARGVFLGGGSGWYADLPSSRARFRIRVEGPAGMEAVTAGALLERAQEQDRAWSLWQTSYPLPSLTLAAGPFQVEQNLSGPVAIMTYFRPESASLSEAYLKASRRYLELYTGLFGPYPFEKFAVVENFFPTGYGMPSWTLLGSTVIRLPFILDTSLGHEIAHSWWGTGVTSGKDGNWSEGLTTYLADHLYQERVSAEAGKAYRLRILRDYASLVDPALDFPLKEFTSHRGKADQAVGYGKAAMVFHMARKLVGDEAFFTGLRQLASQQMFGSAGWQDFARAFDPGGNLGMERFFEIWPGRPGAPEPALAHLRLSREDNGWKVRGQIVQQSPPFPLPLKVRLETEAGPVEQRLRFDGRELDVEFNTDARPLTLVVDPDGDMFRRLSPAEVPPTVNSALGAEPPLVVLAEGAGAPMEKAARMLLAAYGYENPLLKSEKGLRPEDLKNRNLLVVGLPVRGDLIREFPRELAVEPSAFAFSGQRFDGAEAVLFAALPHPLDGQRTLSIFLPLSAEAAMTAARKIPHYGKYSYLVFDEKGNRLKGTWEPRTSPLVHRFSEEEIRGEQ